MTAEDKRKAVDEAIKSCINDGILTSFLTKHRGEVIDVVLTEFDEVKFADSLRAEGREEGRAEGRIQLLYSLITDGTLSVEDAAAKFGTDVPAFCSEAEKYGFSLSN